MLNIIPYFLRSICFYWHLKGNGLGKENHIFWTYPILFLFVLIYLFFSWNYPILYTDIIIATKSEGLMIKPLNAYLVPCILLEWE